MSREQALERSKEQQRKIKAENDMTKAKPTKGRWYVAGKKAVEPEVMCGEKYVATCLGHLNPGEALANARLISAAPELLEACKSAEWNSLDLPAHTTALLRAAIAKATGETP